LRGSYWGKTLSSCSTAISGPTSTSAPCQSNCQAISMRTLLPYPLRQVGAPATLSCNITDCGVRTP